MSTCSPTVRAGGQLTVDTLGGGVAPSLVAKVPSGVRRIMPAGDKLYFTTQGGSLMWVPIDGSDAPCEFAGGLNQPWGIAVDSAFVYLTERGAGRVLGVPR